MLALSRIIGAGYLLLALVVVGMSALLGPLPFSAAPIPIFAGPPGAPVELSIAYGTEKEAWLEEAVRRFEETNPQVGRAPVTITLEGVGSREGVQEIVGGNRKPVVFSPASSIQVELLRSEWEARQGSSILHSDNNAPQPLVYTPLVVVAWEERAHELWPNGPEDLWHHLHEVLSNSEGWGAFGHPEWGVAKFGHTSPETSNSGIQTLVLLTYAYHNKTTGLTTQDVLDQAYQQWLDGIENSVLEFGNSTGTFMKNMINFGPGKYDFVVVYENLAIENVEAARGRWGQDLRVYYPPATIFSDHPYTILNAEWVSDEQREAARLFRDFLLSEEIQALAIEYGFRPASSRVSVSSSDSPFVRYAEYNVRAEDLPPQIDIPDAEVLHGLLDLWRRRYGQ
jgi:ABC-type Fe3+ transport system substrate-binding protein